MSGPRVGVLWLTDVQHAGTSSVARLYRELDAALSEHASVARLPSRFAHLTTPERDQAFAELFRVSELVVVPSPYSAEAFRQRRRLRGRVPFLYLPLGELPRGAPHLRQALPFFGAQDTVAVSCSADRAILRALVATLPSRVVTLPFFVDTARFHPVPVRRRALIRRSLGLPTKKTLVTYLGRITAEKNVHGFLRALRPVLESTADVEGVVVGPVDDQPFEEFGTGPFALEPLLRAALGPKLGRRVHFLPELAAADVPAVLAASDVFASLTLHGDENFGFTQLEAMSAGLPVLATDWGGLKDTVVEGITGLLVDTVVTPGAVHVDVLQATRHLRRLVAEPSLRTALGRAGRQRALQDYAIPVFHHNVGRVVSQCLGRTGRRSARKATFTPLGERVVEALGGGPGATDGSDLRTDPPLGRYAPSDHAVYEALITPYATRRQHRTPRPEEVLFIAPSSVALDGLTLAWLDPHWPRALRLTSAQARLLTSLTSLLRLRKGDGISVRELLGRVGGGAAAFRALTKLVTQGTVGVSSQPASAQSVGRGLSRKAATSRTTES